MNFDDRLHSTYDWPTPFSLIDSTLRKTLFTAGATTTMDGFVRIAAALGAAGVREESININWGGGVSPIPNEAALVQALASTEFGFRLNVYADTLLSDGENYQQVGMQQTVDLLHGWGVRTFAPGIVPPPNAAAKARQYQDLEEFFAYIQALESDATITLANVGRRDFDELVEACNIAVELGARRLDLMDSTSSLGPEAMKLFVRTFRERLVRDVPITMHVHDDFGLGTATAIAAATAGASPDVSVSGMSYRAGFAALEEVVLSLEVLYGVDTGIELSSLTELAHLVARESSIAIPPMKPVVGEYAHLKHMPGDVLGVITGGPDVFPPVSSCVSPSVVGGTAEWVWDSLSTERVAGALLESLDIDATAAEVSDIRNTLDCAVAQIDTYPRWIVAEDAIALTRNRIEELRMVAGHG
ncbi:MULTISPECIES: 2-isopropylmalate synthase [Rhodococcus]|uniref:2-isopropylmalate synthase n=1 Tax=Rhodococcus globerulus TaxID=33008 RepID=UPI001FD5357E|nr:2-isopropylmalate synthase [Rhodococcus globerulus]